MSWMRSTAGANKIHKLNCCHIYAMILILSEIITSSSSNLSRTSKRTLPAPANGSIYLFILLPKQ